MAKLDYFSPAVSRSSMRQRLIKLTGMPVDPALMGWWRGRLAYSISLAILFSAIAFYFGPNLIRFHKLTSLTTEDFGWYVQAGTPTVRAMMQFRRDHGRLPNDEDELVPAYLPKDQDYRGNIARGAFSFWARDGHMITYNFGPVGEGFYVSGPDVNGRISWPPVTLEPDPMTRPSF
jgi:hypothetical protein